MKSIAPLVPTEAAGPADSQESPADPLADEERYAGHLLQSGIESFRERRLADAVAELKQCVSLEPSPEVALCWKNLAAASFRRGDVEGAGDEVEGPVAQRGRAVAVADLARAAASDQCLTASQESVGEDRPRKPKDS